MRAQNKEWFLARIGKQVRRLNGKGAACCKVCARSKSDGFEIGSRAHASYLADVAAEMGYRYVEVKPAHRPEREEPVKDTGIVPNCNKHDPRRAIDAAMSGEGKRRRYRMAKKMIWMRGYDWATKVGYKELRDCRIIAMAFEHGWRAAIRRRKRTARGKGK